MVREIDALGGMMGLATDQAGIQFRMLNRRKGPAVWAPRAQADRDLYHQAVLGLLKGVSGLDLIEGTVDELIVEETGVFDPRANKFAYATPGDKPRANEFAHASPAILSPLRIRGVRLADGRELRAGAVVLTTGTFLKGLMHCGEAKTVGGRIGEPASENLSDNLRQLGLSLARLKTGTPPRVDRDSVDFSKLTAQPGDDHPVPFSFMTDRIEQRQIECWITYTNRRTHEIIRANLDRAPMYSGQIKSLGPRYCPSIEDKVVRFADKDRHQLFLEPEGYDNPWLYCNGISTSLPKEVQERMVHSIVGLEGAEIVQYGYAIEYDCVPTDQIGATLETKGVAGLFLAGQVNGTSGYEEAAGQGLVAGINAAAKLGGREPLVLRRDQAYIGVMIDDIVTRPPDEPYRMFTSRAEYRLRLRSDNADIRLTELGRSYGLVDDARWRQFTAKKSAIEGLQAGLHATSFEGCSLMDWLRRPKVSLSDLFAKVPAFWAEDIPAAVLEAVEIQGKYAGYLEREQQSIERYWQLESRAIPDSIDYSVLNGLRQEARDKFSRIRPRNLGQAARLSGISPADIATLSLYLFQHRGESG
jgi:tRNA uridine 5-carboxymethylaminomethyl modification enzyme